MPRTYPHLISTRADLLPLVNTFAHSPYATLPLVSLAKIAKLTPLPIQYDEQAEGSATGSSSPTVSTSPLEDPFIDCDDPSVQLKGRYFHTPPRIFTIIHAIRLPLQSLIRQEKRTRTEFVQSEPEVHETDLAATHGHEESRVQSTSLPRLAMEMNTGSSARASTLMLTPLSLARTRSLRPRVRSSTMQLRVPTIIREGQCWSPGARSRQQ